jgi:hypothetical protein
MCCRIKRTGSEVGGLKTTFLYSFFSIPLRLCNQDTKPTKAKVRIIVGILYEKEKRGPSELRKGDFIPYYST